MNKFLYYFSWSVIILLIGLVLLCGYWLLFPYNPLEINYPENRNVLLVENREVKGGEHLTIHLDFCKNTNIVPIISAWFVDGLLYQSADVPAFPKKTGCQKVNLQIYVPKGLPEGEFAIQRTYSYKMNPLRTIHVTFKTETFTISHNK